MSEGFPENEFGLGLLTVAFTVFAALDVFGDIFPGIGEEKEADGSYQDQEKNPDIGFRFHD